MGISYNGVGGIGIELTEEIIQKLISANIFTEEEWEEEEELSATKRGEGGFGSTGH